MSTYHTYIFNLTHRNSRTTEIAGKPIKLNMINVKVYLIYIKEINFSRGKNMHHEKTQKIFLGLYVPGYA